MVRVHLSDGSFFILHGEVFALAGISVGAPLDDRRIANLKSQSESVFARQSALGLLSRAPHTRRGLASKLRARGFDQEAVRQAVARMIELGYLDDRSFAESWMRFRLPHRREGSKALFLGLVRRGVPRDIAEEVVREMCTDDAEMESARLLVEGLAPGAAARRLAGRGFRARIIAGILKEMKGQDREAREE